MFFSKKKPDLSAQIRKGIVDFFALPAAAGEKIEVRVQDTCIEIVLPFTAKTQFDAIQEKLRAEIEQIGQRNIDIAVNVPITAAKLAPIPHVKNVIAVSSGKGGVGKSATAVNLAFALAKQGARVGLLDADIYGPSIPIMLGNVDAHPASEDQRIMQPLKVQGVVANSIGYLIDADSAAIWRGPMVTKALKQLVYETQWPLLDYLIVDLPPGTGDIHLTLAQQVPLSAAVIVSTPQTIATADAKKGIAMFEKLDIPVLGIVENMSYFACSCGQKHYPFSQGGSALLAQQHDMALLGELPLSAAIRTHADEGIPLLMVDSENKDILHAQQTYLTIAQQVSISIGTSIPLHQVVRDKSNQQAGLGIPVVNKS